MSIAALALVLAHVAIFDVVRKHNEGAPAHAWQLLMVGQLSVVQYFAAKWLPQPPDPAFRVRYTQT